MRKSTKQKILLDELDSIVQEQRAVARRLPNYDDDPEYRRLRKQIKALEHKAENLERVYRIRTGRVHDAIKQQYLAIRRLIALEPDNHATIAKALDKFKAAKFTA